MPVQGGEETEVLNDVEGGGWPNWAISPNGIYFLKFGKFPAPASSSTNLLPAKLFPCGHWRKIPAGD